MEDLKISIITPSFNQGKFIEKTIKSIIDQNYSNYEHIIIDGGSTDSTLDILNKYRNDVYFISENDKGQVNAINKGLHLATGDIIAFLNSDDFYLPNTFNVVNDLFSRSGCNWIIGDSIIVDEKNNEIHKFIRHYKKIIRNFNSQSLLYITNYICQPSTFWKKNFSESIGSFDEKLSFVFDYKQWLLMYKINQPLVTNEILSAFRIHQDSKGNLFYKKQFNEEIDVLRSMKVNKLLFALHKVSNLFIKAIYLIIK
jgi:glycosyltransferase involved in cell wall biosynthesis